MIQITATQAASNFEGILKDVAKGQEVVIIDEKGQTYKLLALPRNPKPLFGSAKGLVELGPDFDDPIDGFEDYS